LRCAHTPPPDQPRPAHIPQLMEHTHSHQSASSQPGVPPAHRPPTAWSCRCLARAWFARRTSWRASLCSKRTGRRCVCVYLCVCEWVVFGGEIGGALTAWRACRGTHRPTEPPHPPTHPCSHLYTHLRIHPPMQPPTHPPTHPHTPPTRTQLLTHLHQHARTHARTHTRMHTHPPAPTHTQGF
jgi:hypothetical protein